MHSVFGLKEQMELISTPWLGFNLLLEESYYYWFRSNNKTAIAVADDFGKVRMFQYPAIYPKAPSDAYRGHSAHVTRVSFTLDDRFLLSAGGNDAAILQWAVSAKQ